MGPKKAGARRSGRRIPAKLAAEALFDYAVKYLALQASSTDALRAKLRMKAANPVDIDATIERLKDIGYLNDARFAESYALNRAENEGFGRMRVLSDLRAKRVPGGLADKAVEQVFQEKDEGTMIDAYIGRRMPSLALKGKVDDQKELAKAYRRLRRAGFSSGGIMTALKRVAARPELIDEPPPDEEGEEGIA